MAEAATVITTFSRRSATVCAAGLLAGLGVFIWMLGVGQPTPRFSREGILIIAALGGVTFFIGFLLAAVQCFKPSRLVLSSTGFQLEWIWSLPLIRWKDVERFGLERQGPVKHVGFRLTPAASQVVGQPWWRMAPSKEFDAAVFTGIGGAPDRVLGQLREWHRQYGG